MDVSLCISFERDPSEFARCRVAGVIYMENKNHRSLETSRARPRGFILDVSIYASQWVPTAVGKNEIENWIQKLLVESLNRIMCLL